MKEPLVSICCITYNHAAFIRQCLDGFLNQKCNFNFEIIIHDDASTDGTEEILREYEKEYPTLFKILYEKENQYSQGVRGIFATFCYPRAKGKYIALCEGDDYWTDSYKLQKQVDFLESHPDYSICGHWVQSYNQNTKNYSDFFTDDIDTYDLAYFANGGNWCPTLSVVYRRTAFNQEVYSLYKKAIDITLFFHLLKSGLAYCIHDKMAVYRIHGGGVWSGKSGEQRTLADFEVRLALYEVEKSKAAACFIRSIFLSDFGRKWMITNIPLMITVSRILSKHFGWKYVCKLYYRFLINRNLPIPVM